jgi:hypothetical protein
LLFPAAAGAALTDQQVEDAVDGAVGWIRAHQEPSGALGENGGLDPAWAFLGLAGAGINAADLRVAPGDPSAQDYYLSLWTSRNDENWTSLGTPQASDYERVTMLAHAAGLDPLRLSATQNMLAKMARFDHGGFFGPKNNLNQTMFALIALNQLPVPDWLTAQEARIIGENAHKDGGFTFATVSGQIAFEKPGEIDLTGAAIAGLCGAGMTAADPVVAKAIGFLESSAEGGSLGNADSVSWALDGLATCGVRRGSSSWTPVDEHVVESLVSQQRPDGGWATSPTGTISNYYATQDALRALADPGFEAEPPPRLNPADPVKRQPPSVPAGTAVPVVLAIDAGYEDIRLCSTKAPIGATLPEVLLAAREEGEPEGCVAEVEADSTGISSLDGAVALPGGGGWKVSREAGVEEDAADQPIGFGEVVALRLEDPAPLRVTSAALTFPAQEIGGADGRSEVTLTNRGAAPVKVTDARISGAAAGDYTVVGDACNGQILAEGASCIVGVAFRPGAEGDRLALLEVETEAQGTVAVALRGHGDAHLPGGSATPQGGTPTAPGGTPPAAAAPVTAGHALATLRIEKLEPGHLVVHVDGPGRVRLTITRLDGPKGRPKVVKTLAAVARSAGRLRLNLPDLPPGRYRLTVAAPGAKQLTRTLTIERKAKKK